MIESEWDANKAPENFAKHGVSFEEAETVFSDLSALVFKDELHSINEERWTIVGYSVSNRLLVVTYTNRGEKVRLITARTAERRERSYYEEELL